MDTGKASKRPVSGTGILEFVGARRSGCRLALHWSHHTYSRLPQAAALLQRQAKSRAKIDVHA